MKSQYSKKLVRLLGQYLDAVEVDARPKMDETILADGFKAMDREKQQAPGGHDPGLWRRIMKNRKSPWIAAAAVIAVALSISLLDIFSAPAWALEETIAALKKYRGLHMKAVIIDGAGRSMDCELWLRANKTGMQSQDFILRTAQGTIVWVRDGATYEYDPASNTVYFEKAVTQGFSHWFGPRLFALLQRADNKQVIYGDDPATGRMRVTFRCSLVDMEGPESWVFEFDGQTKLPVSLKQWSNLDRSGAPSFWAREIVYYEQLPDSEFIPTIPQDASYVEKEPTIPQNNLSVLADPRSGISCQGLTKEQAAQEIIRQICAAVKDEDLSTFKRLCPLTEMWGDDLLEAVVFGLAPEDRLAEVVEIASIMKQGKTPLGTYVIIPLTLRRQDDSLWQEKLIVQFREGGAETTCVVHGPYGMPVQIE